MNVLLVEDNPNVRRLIKSLLSDLVSEFVECDDGSQALEAYSNKAHDWVLMDIEMPVVDGITATRQIRAVFPDARIAIVTNYDHQKLRTAAFDAGAQAFISKENLFALRSLLSLD